MFNFAIFLGIYSYLIFSLGLLHLFYKEIVIFVTLLLVLPILFFKYNTIVSILEQVVKYFREASILLRVFLLLLFVQGLVNVLGALTPELAFDALWYHLTLPKLYLIYHAIEYIPGGLLYYSVMPKLGEMLFVGGLAFGNEFTVKIIHFLFGILTCFALYKFGRMFFSPFIAALSVVIFYANLVVAWESTTAYIDLIRTFFEVLALWAFVLWYRTKRKKWFVISALMIGLAITTKLLAFGSLLLFIIVTLGIFLRQREFKNGLRNTVFFSIIAVIVPLPWLLFAWIHTGNPVYPFFSPLYEITPMTISFTQFFYDSWVVFTQASDPISPLYIIFLPLVVMLYPKFPKEIKLLSLFSLLAIILWYFTPRTGGGRFILPYLPAFSIVCAGVIDVVSKHKKFPKAFYYALILLVLIVSLISIGYRSAASSKYLPVLLGQESNETFLKNNLNFRFGDYYDVDGQIAKIVKDDDQVLLYGFHNLYYVDFAFIDASWVKKGDTFTYIATQNTTLPDRFKDWQPIYTNEQTLVKLYKPPKNRCTDNICVY